MKIYVCDDEPVFSEQLSRYILEYYKNEETAIRSFCSSAELYDAIQNDTPDMIFLDIRMPSEDGVEIAKSLRKQNCDCAIVFVTAFEDRAVDGYGVNAFDFIVKPTNPERVGEVLERYEKSKPSYYTAVLKDGTVRKFRHSIIIYAEVSGRNTVLHTKDGIFEVREPIKNVIPLLSNMIEIYKGIYVNIDEITRIGKDTLEVAENETLPVSRRNRKNVISALMKAVRSR